MRPEDYDAWYRTPRGAWIGETEYHLLWNLLAPRPGERLLDVGCGTGYFTRRFATEGVSVTGLDPDPGMLAFARFHAAAGESYLLGDARSLPFADRSFDLCVSVTALCFIHYELRAVSDILRVTRRRFALGLLNRHSLLYFQKGRHGGKGAYRGARWHTTEEAARLFEGLPAANLQVRSAILVPGGGRLARRVEGHRVEGLPWGSFIAVAGEVCA